MTTYGVTQAGFVAKPTSAILAGFESSELATMDPAIDLSATSPLGQLNGIVANALSEAWQVLGVAFNSNNRQAAEGAILDNVGGLVGIPREGESYTQVYADLHFTSGAVGSTYVAGQLVANVAGNASFTFANLLPLIVTATAMPGVLMQSQNIGATAGVNPNTLNVITNTVSGWVSVNNPAAQSQLGANAELDANYSARQESELGVIGSCNPSATVAAILQLGASQEPPVSLSASEVENGSNATITVGTITLPPHTYAVVVYDSAGWSATSTGQSAIAQVIWNNKPAGITSIGSTTVLVSDANLGSQPVSFSVATPLPLYVSAALVIRTGYTFAGVSSSAATALIQASTALTPAGGTPPNGQLVPGGTVIGSQLQAVLMGVPGVQDVQSLTFDFSAVPTNTSPLSVPSTQVATITAADLTNLVFTPGVFP